MARVTPQQAADKWVRRTSAATQDYTAGIQSVSVAPGQAAAKQAQVAATNYTEAISSGRWASRVSAVSLQEWQAAATTKGGPRLASGVQAASNKMASFMSAFLPFEDNVVNQVRAMPRGSLEENIARSAALQRLLAAYKSRR